MAAARLRAAARAGHPHAPAGVRRGRRCIVLLGVGVVPRLGQELLPELQGARLPDALGDQARHVAARRRSASRRPAPRSCGDPRRPQRRLAHRPGLPSRTSRTASTSARTGSASTSRSTTTRRSPRSRRWSTAIPGLRRDVQTYLKERIREVLTGSSETIVVHIFGDDLETLRTTADDVQDMIADGRRGRRGERRAPGRRPPGGGQGRSRRRRSATGSSRATSGGRPPRS